MTGPFKNKTIYDLPLMQQLGTGDFILVGRGTGPTGLARLPQEFFGMTGPVGPTGPGGTSIPILTINSQTGSYTLVASDQGKMVQVTTGSGTTGTVFVPNNATVAFATGTQIQIVRGGTGALGITGVTGVSIDSAQGFTNLKWTYSSAMLVKAGLNQWYLFGDLKA